MAGETLVSLRTEISKRVRDPLNTAHDSDTVDALLSYCQQLTNAATSAARAALFTGSGTPTLPFISLASLGIRVSEVRIGHDNPSSLAALPLRRIDWRVLAAEDPLWLGREAAWPTCWDLMGQDLLLLWPRWRVPFTIYMTRLNDQPLTTTTFLPAEHVPMLLAMTESVLLLRQRLFASMPASAKREQQIRQGLAFP